jgi:hypothetical protein
MRGDLMRYLKMLVIALLAVVMFGLNGCGGSGSTASDPFQKTPPSDQTQQNPIFNNISTVTGKIALSLTTDVPSIDVDNGQGMAIAKVKAGNVPVAGVTVSFSVLTPSSLITLESNSAVTDSTGTAVTRITSGHVASTSNVLLQASIKMGTQTVITNANLQLIRGGGVIMFDSNAGIAPGSQSNLLPLRKETVPAGGPWAFYELIPFKVTDANRNPRVGVPVTISVYSITTMNPDSVKVDFLVPPMTEQNQQTITSDSAGQGIFNTRVTMGNIAANQSVVVNIVYRAVTNDPIPVTAYLGVGYQITGQDDTQTPVTAK